MRPRIDGDIALNQPTRISECLRLTHEVGATPGPICSPEDSGLRNRPLPRQSQPSVERISCDVQNSPPQSLIDVELRIFSTFRFVERLARIPV